ncbi:MAG: DUF423 domain-containing protein [Pseudomonadota bacterium]
MPYFIILGAIFAMLAVAFGAMGAHFLKNIIDAQALTVFQTASTYQMYHAFALILTALSLEHTHNTKVLNIAGWLFLAGIILFSGSLYGLSLFGLKYLGMITPIGGVCFIIAWLLFAISFMLKAENVEVNK